MIYIYLLGIGDWGLGIGAIPNPQSPIPENFNNKNNENDKRKGKERKFILITYGGLFDQLISEGIFICHRTIEFSHGGEFSTETPKKAAFDESFSSMDASRG